MFMCSLQESRVVPYLMLFDAFAEDDGGTDQYFSGDWTEQILELFSQYGFDVTKVEERGNGYANVHINCRRTILC